MAEQSSKSDSIFWAALGIAAPEERGRYLDEACAGDPNQRAQLDELLAAYPKVERFLEQPANGDATVHHGPSISEQPGTVIGPYKLLQQIGEGGMGVVFMAEQTEPIQRTVALKIIKPGMDTRQVIARFEAERQALAMMDHPNIARVLDAGTTDSGRPYFVMELVKGVPITKYCDEKHLPLRARLELLLPVCQAVQHAHQKGVIHRDIKPTNVLVAEYDDHAVPKVIDFGVAKATATKLTDLTMFTEFGQVVGTVEYMSPEQAKLNQLDIDTRSDIYSLGVLLYELLTGSTPFGRQRLQSAAFDEMLRIIREEEPQKPSTRLSTTAELPSIAANRALEPGKLSSVVKGELDWIVMKALEKDRNRRYDTAGNFAADVLRHLSDQPVEACPPSVAYRFRKFIRRNRVGVLAGSAIATAIMLGLTFSAIGFVQARRQAVRADREASNARSEAAKAIVAQGQAEAALIQKDDALKAVQEKELLQRRRFYSAQMNLAQQALVAGDPARVLDLLESNRPHPGEADLRGFEWYYLWGQIHRGLRASINFPEGREHWGLAISPDGNTIAISGGTAQDSGVVKLWDTDSGRLKQTLSLGAYGASLLAFAPDGAVLASGTWDGTISLWRMADRLEIARISSGFGLVRALQFSPDGKRLAAGFENGALRILDAVSLKTIAVLKPHGGPVINICYSPNGARLYSAAAWGTEGILTRVHDMTKNPPEAVDELKGFCVMDISPDGRFLVSTGRGMTLWNIAEKKAVWKFAPHPGIISDVKFTPDGNSLISAGRQDRLAIRWDIATHKAVMRVPHSKELSVVACTCEEKAAWVSLSNDGTAKIWDLTPSADANTIHLDNPIKTMVAMPDGQSVMCGGDFQARIWNLQTGALNNNSSAATFVRSISGDGRWLASIEAVDPGKKTGVKIWDTATGEPRHVVSMPHGELPLAVRISPDGKYLATCTSGGPILLWNLTDSLGTTSEPLRIQYRDPNGPFLLHSADLTFSPDSGWLAAACQFGVVNLYNLKTKQIVTLPMPHAPWAWRVAFSGDGKLLAAGNDVGLVCVFDIETAAMIASLAGHEARIAALAFFPDGRTLAVASRNTIRIWDVPSHQERITLTVAADADVSEPVDVEDLAITPDGRILLSRQSDGTVRVWRGAGEAAEHPAGAPVDKNLQVSAARD